jgi:hypothetical protein
MFGTRGFGIIPNIFFLLDHGVCQKVVLENFKILFGSTMFECLSGTG